MDNITIYTKEKVLTEVLCQKCIEIYYEKRDSNNPYVNINFDILDLLNPHIQEYLLELVEKQTIYPQQLQKKKIYVNKIKIEKYPNDTAKTENDNEYKNMLNFIIFLNDIAKESGGEFVFHNKTAIPCEKGRVVIYPNEWFYPNENTNPQQGCEKYCLLGKIFVE